VHAGDAPTKESSKRIEPHAASARLIDQQNEWAAPTLAGRSGATSKAFVVHGENTTRASATRKPQCGFGPHVPALADSLIKTITPIDVATLIEIERRWLGLPSADYLGAAGRG
jgi:hypothetical protein